MSIHNVPQKPVDDIKPGTQCIYTDINGKKIPVVYVRKLRGHSSIDNALLFIVHEYPLPKTPSAEVVEFWVPPYTLEPLKDAECFWVPNSVTTVNDAIKKLNDAAKSTFGRQAPTREQVTDFMKELDNDPDVVKLGEDSESNPETTNWIPKPGEKCWMAGGTGHHVIPVIVIEKMPIIGTYLVQDTWTKENHYVNVVKLSPTKDLKKSPIAKAVEHLIQNYPPWPDIQFKKGTFKSGGIAEGPTIEKESGGEFVIPCTLRVKPKPHTNDTVVRDVRKDLKRRSKAGIEKYGTTLDRKDLSLKEWLQHAYEECLDQALYLKRAIRELDKPSGDELEAKV